MSGKNNNISKANIMMGVSSAIGGIIATIGFLELSYSVLGGIIFVFVASLFIYPINKFIKAKLHWNFSGGISALIIVGLLILGFVIGYNAPESTPSTTKQSEVSQDPNKTDQQRLEDNLRQSSDKKDITYRAIDVQKADADRPADSKMITASYTVVSFYNKNSLLRDTGEISGKAFQVIFSSNLNAYDAIVWYYGETTDRYGNKNDTVVLSYAIDKPTYAKINWQSFDIKNLCDFLKQEQSINPDSGNVCIVRSVIQ